jgi:uncharacterized protein (TIGR03437 family)
VRRLLLCCLAVAAAALAQSPQNIVVTSASSFQVGIPARGSIGAIFCTGVIVSGTVQAAGAPLPWSLAGVSVTVGGANAPLFSVSALNGYQQINFQVPQEAVFAFDGSATITVTQNGNTGIVTAQSLYASPGDFFMLPNSPYGPFQHTDFSLVTGANPAKAGETIIGYLTGLPGTVPVVPTGQASPYSPLAVVPQPRVGSGERFISEYSVVTSAGPASISFLGLAPGLVGVYQMNFDLPFQTPPGDLSIRLDLRKCLDTCLFTGPSFDSKSVVLPVR